MSASSARLRAAQAKARMQSAAVDEGLLGIARGIDRLIRDRAELLVSLEEVLDKRWSFIEKNVRSRARAAVARAKAP